MTSTKLESHLSLVIYQDKACVFEYKEKHCTPTKLKITFINTDTHIYIRPDRHTYIHTCTHSTFLIHTSIT